jgi:hypothetical protein
MAALIMRKVEMRRLACALVALFKAAVTVSRIDGKSGFRKEASNLIEGGTPIKGFSADNSLF